MLPHSLLPHQYYLFNVTILPYQSQVTSSMLQCHLINVSMPPHQCYNATASSPMFHCFKYLVDVCPQRRHLVPALVQRASAAEHGEEEHPCWEHVAGGVARQTRHVFRGHVVHPWLDHVRDVRVPLLELVVSLPEEKEEWNIWMKNEREGRGKWIGLIRGCEWPTKILGI